MEKGARVESAIRQMVRRRQTKCFGKLPGSASHRTTPQQGGNYLGRRTRGSTHADVSTVASRSLPLRKCAEAKQDKKRRSGDHLFAEYSRGCDCHAGLRKDRCRAFGSVWRV